MIDLAAYIIGNVTGSSLESSLSCVNTDKVIVDRAAIPCREVYGQKLLMD